MRAIRAGELLDHAFHRLAEQIPIRDRAWTQELVYGTVRLRGRLDYLLAQFVRRPFESLDPDVLDILRLGAYQLLEMRSVPAYAAVSQAVEITQATAGRGPKGLVNGVLQSLRRAEPELQPPSERNAVEFLSTWGSHPRWLVERWLSAFGRDDAFALVQANNVRPELFVRLAGTLGRAGARALGRSGVAATEVDAVIEALGALDITADRVEGVPEGVGISSSDVGRVIEAVPVVVQDPAAMLVVRYADFAAGPVADLCAAPGGKALAITGIESDVRSSFVLASDVSFGRLLKVRENAQRVGSTDTAFVVADARRAPIREIAQILIDAPCTGTGTLRRHPDGKWRLTPEDLVTLVELQGEILDAAAPLVSPGGLLVYATCSLEPEENEHQVNRFLEQHLEFALEPSNTIDSKFLDGGQLRVLPHKHGFDGAYAARLRKRA